MKAKICCAAPLIIVALISVTAPMHAAPLNLSALGSNIANAQLSPDGARVVYQKKTAQGWRIYTARSDGSAQKALSNGPKNDVEPSWRADGALVAFASDRAGNYDLYAVRPDGTSLRQITKTAIDERAPQWSPRPFGLFKPDDYAVTDHGVMGRKKSDVGPSELKLLELLAKNKGDSSEGGWDDYKAKFDLKAIKRYYKLLCVEGSGDKRQIATMRDDGSLRQTLNTGMPGAHLNPSWERSDRAIAFSRRVGQQTAIYLADYPNTSDLNSGAGALKLGIDTQEWRKSIQRLYLAPTPNVQLSWTPNGEYVAVALGSELRLLPRPHSGLATLTTKSAALAPYSFGWLGDGKTALVTTSNLKLQTVKVENPLLDVMNIRDFSDDIEASERYLLARNSFVAAGPPRKQMYHVYEETDYEDLPIFITTDSLLHLNHLIFDYLLRGVETEHLMPEVIALSQHYLQSSLAQMNLTTNPQVKSAARGNAAFFAVAARLAMGAVKTGELSETAPNDDDPLGVDRAKLRARTMQKQSALLKLWTTPLLSTLDALPADIKQLADEELKLISAHAGMANSPIFGGELTGVGQPDAPLIDTRIDYSDFIPRGHYSRSEILRRYFLVTRWLSGAPFRPNADGSRRALLIMSATNPPTQTRLNRVLDVMSVFVGEADDADLKSYAPIAQNVFGGVPGINNLADEAKIKSFVNEVVNLPQPRIAASRGAAFRFLPQPYTLDAEIMQNMVYDRHAPDVGTENVPRYFALGLDVMGVLGSDRARQILDETKFGGTFFNFDLKETQYENYNEQFDTERARYHSMSDAEWNRNLYTRTLRSILPLLQPTKSAYKFTQNQAWTDKNLNTALGTWAELKHDTMPKMPVSIEAGGEGGLSEAPLWEQPRGAVEPAPLVYQRLSELVGAERAALQSAGYLSPERKQRLDTFSALLTMIANLEKKQAAGAPWNASEIEQLRFYGAYQEHLTFVTAEGEGASMEANDMAIVADVASAYSTVLNQQLVLQEGVGRALPIYVAIERNGRRELARGAIFSYYEFTHPADDRLTDEKWREVLDGDNAPKLPEWTKSFVSRVGASE